MEKAFKYLILFVLFTSCSRYTISYNHAKIQQKEDSGFKILLNKKIINSRLTFLNKKNIEQVVINKKQMQIQIVQKDTASKFFKMNEVFGKTENKNPKEIAAVIIDGIPFQKKDFEVLQIEVNSIKSLSFLSQSKLSEISCNGIQGDYFVIQTKQ